MSWLSDNELDSAIRGNNFILQQQRLNGFYCGCHPTSLACFLDNDLFHRKGLSCYDHLLSLTHHYKGVFAADQLPPHQLEPMCFIMNSDPASKPGTHWMAYYQDGQVCEFFDSFGQSASFYPHIYQWLKNSDYERLPCRLQGPSAYCGAFCYFYLTQRPKARSMYNLFFTRGPYIFQCDRDLDINDSFVFQYLYYDIENVLNKAAR